MGEVMKIVEEKVGDVTTTTTYHFTELEDFLYWESGEGGNIEALTLSENESEESSGDDEGYKIVGNISGHGFKEGEVVFLISLGSDVYYRARNTFGVEHLLHKEEVVKL